MKKLTYLLLIILLISCSEDPNSSLYKLSVEVSGHGSYEVSPLKNDYQDGEVVTLTALPDSGWKFNRWLGSINTNYNPLHLTMDGNKSIKLVFSIPFEPTMNGDWEGIQFNIEFHIQQALFDSSLTGSLVLHLPDGRNISYAVTGYNNVKLIQMNCRKSGYYEIEYLGTWSNQSKILGGVTENGIYYKCDLQRQGDGPLAVIQKPFISKKMSKQ